MGILDVGDKLAPIGAFVVTLVVAIASLGSWVRRERSSSPTRPTPSIRYLAVIVAGVAVLGMLVLAIAIGPGYALLAAPNSL